MSLHIHARQLLSPSGWQSDQTVSVGRDGMITGVGDTPVKPDHCVDVLLPALSNLHSHSFQHAMAGLAETASTGDDDFWSWRQIMYHFLERLTPEHIGTIAAYVQMQMLEAGYAAQAEFHYLHHQADGTQYSDIAETSRRHLDAAVRTGIGYTHLPVLYTRGGTNDRELTGSQRRFGGDVDRFADLFETLRGSWRKWPADFELGVAPHSLRAVKPDGLALCTVLAPEGPIHIHAAEQTSEVDEVVAALGSRPVQWLLDHHDIDSRWCLIHATHLDAQELRKLAVSDAAVGLCPLTEANLGDGIFPATEFVALGGRYGIGSDSNLRITLTEELRTLEHSQRLRDRRRVRLTTPAHNSNGRSMYEQVALGGAQALGRRSGRIETGYYADLVALDGNHLSITGLRGDAVLDAWLFASADDVVSDVWSAGRHQVREGRHIDHDRIAEDYRRCITTLRQSL